MNTMLRSSAQAFALKAAPFGSRRRSTAATTAPVRPRGSWRLSRKYIFPILLFSAVSSLAINVRNARDDIKFIEDQHAAQLSVLRDLIRRMTAGESISQAQLLKEYERVGIIKREGEFQSKPSQHITWKEMLFGRKKEARDQDIEDRELANIEKVLNEAAQAADSGRSSISQPKRVVERSSPTLSSSAHTPPSTSSTNSNEKRPPTVLI